ncbi:MAG: energy-dependent translational throttle protein EttA [Planctomycetes bacterium]|nr:energy-dependent translational throttle protein EttA [Planctomycetota bacterium]
MAGEYICSLERITKTYPGRTILQEITLSFFHGAKIGVVGANGTGKSTLLRIIAGEDKEFDGVCRRAERVSIGYLPQEPRLDPAQDVRGNLEEGVAATRALLARHEAIGKKLEGALDDDAMQKALDDLSAVQEKIEACGGWELEHQIEVAAHALGVPPLDAPVGPLSGGERRRVALCRLLLRRPDLLLLDEPTNHLDAESVAWMERHLQAYTGTVILVTHDRYFLDHVVGWMLELDRGRALPYEGNYSAFLEAKQKRLDTEERQQAARRKILARELEWVRTSPSARRAKSKARMDQYDRLLAQVQGYDGADEGIEFRLPPGPPMGNRVLEAKEVRKGYGGRLLIDGLTFELPRGGIVGILGPNGAGKTTLARMMMGIEKPDGGEIRLGESVVPAYVDQERESLDGEKSVFDEVSGGNDFIAYGKRMIPARGYLARFNFQGSDQQKKVAALSGGERNRLQIAKLLRRGANLVLLDEPTNDLDLDTLRTLEEAITGFAGCMVVITHDRWFLDRIATHILAFEGPGPDGKPRVRWFEGDYQAYEARCREEEGERKAAGSGPAQGKGKHRKFEA